ncbi:hypothetical protein D8S78_02095 [Natrialba swarupiae]|nr:hypothetical protein [Natrialba swarupiae]
MGRLEEICSVTPRALTGGQPRSVAVRRFATDPTRHRPGSPRPSSEALASSEPPSPMPSMFTADDRKL